MSVREHTFASPGAPPSLEVRNPAGSVTVTAVEGAETVDVRVEALDAAADDLLPSVDVSATPTDGSGPLRVRVAVPQRQLFRTPRFAVTVTAPARCDLRLSMASADGHLHGPLGRVDVRTASGDVRVERADRLEVRSASGDVAAGAVTGHVAIGTASGDVRIDAASGGLEVRTASGGIRTGRVVGDVTLGTASGDVDVAAVERGAVRLKSVSGDAVVGVVPGQRVWLELSSVSGRMRSELDEEPAGAAGTEVGTPSATVSISARTVSGNVRIHRALAATAR
jgi:DUF4097 and DUF4098 domain-containing protein YvlB